MNMIQTVLAFLQAHMMLTSSISVWMALSLIVNVVLAVRGPAAWVAFAEESPTLAMIINVLVRAFGIDLVSVIEHLQAWLNANAQEEQPPPSAPTA